MYHLNTPTLSYFRSLFDDHKRPLFTMWDELTMQNIFIIIIIEMLYILWASYLQLVYYPTIIIFLKELPFGFNKYTNNFLFCQIYLKLFFVNLITSIFHHLLFHIYLCNIRNIFNITKFIFKKLFKIIGVRL